MPIVPLTKSHLPSVARLQRESIQVGLSVYLGQRFCERLYWGLATTRFSFVLAYEEDGRVLGFVCGATNTSKMLRSVLMRRCVSLGLAAIGKMFSVVVLRKMWIAVHRPKTFTTGDFAEWDLPEAELVSIAVDPSTQGKRIGAQLVDALFDRLRQMGCDRVRVWTTEENTRAVKFYERCGFQWLGMRQHHSGPIHVLVCDLAGGGDRDEVAADLSEA